MRAHVGPNCFLVAARILNYVPCSLVNILIHLLLEYGRSNRPWDLEERASFEDQAARI